MSASVAAVMRAANVDALRPCSAWRMNQDLGGARMRLVERGHPREVRGVPERGVGSDRLLAAPPPDVCGEDRR
jgi:hypothetical protein